MIALTRRDGYPSKRSFGSVGESQIDSRRATTMLTYWIDDELYCFDCGDDHEEAEDIPQSTRRELSEPGTYTDSPGTPSRYGTIEETGTQRA